MGFWFFDESIHSEADFILGAWIYIKDDPSTKIKHVYSKLEISLENEFKSSTLRRGNPKSHALRDSMKEVLRTCKLGILIHPATDRKTLGLQAIFSLITFIKNNRLTEHHQVYLDQGIGDLKLARIEADSSSDLKYCDIRFEQNSKITNGIQLSDLAAHTCAIMLKERMGLITKQIPVIKESRYEPQTMIDIGFEMWAQVRYCFFGGPVSVDPTTLNPDDPVSEISRFGLFISAHCDSRLRTAAEDRFGKMYLGCID